MEDGRIPGYFDTKYVTVLRIERILHNFDDWKIGNFLALEQVNFRVTLVICGSVAYRPKIAKSDGEI